jgi:hypothetical protein
MSSILWTRPQTLQDNWSSDAGTEFVDKWFSIPKISHYFRTRLPVTIVDIDGWHACDLIAPLFFNDNTELTSLFASVLSSLTLLAPSTHLLLKNMQADFLRLCRNRIEAFAPSSVERCGVAASPVSQSTRRLSAMRRLSFLLYLCSLYSNSRYPRWCLNTALRSSRVFMIILIPPRILK